MSKLDHGQKHLLKLTRRDADAEGWAKVSSFLYPHIKKSLPEELVTMELVGDDGSGRAKLTPAGNSLLDAMEWL